MSPWMKLVPHIFGFSLRSLCDLRVSAVNRRPENTHRRDAEVAEAAQVFFWQLDSETLRM
jgi:hypothetical protein